MAGTSNTPPVLPWLSRKTPLDRNRWPMIWKSASRRIRSPNSPTSRFFARYRLWSAGSPRTAVERLQIALPYELAVNGLNFTFYLGGLHSAYVRGEALLAAHRYAEAAAEFQKILDHRGIVGADPIGVLAHLQLGRTLALAGGQGQGKACLRGFSHPLERRRPRHSDSGASEGGIRPAAIARASDIRFACAFHSERSGAGAPHRRVCTQGPMIWNGSSRLC